MHVDSWLLLPICYLLILAGGTYATGEWESSLIVLPNADVDPVSGARTEPRETSLHMVGANEVVVGLTAHEVFWKGYAILELIHKVRTRLVRPSIAQQLVASYV